MIRALLVVLACLVAPLPFAVADEPAAPAPPDSGTKAETGVPAYEVLYLAETGDAGGPQAIIRTGARTEDEWLAIGREIRAARPGFEAVVVFFVSDQAIPIPQGYPACPDDQRQAFERWTLGSYVYQTRNFPYNDTGDVVEAVKLNKATPRRRTMNGVDIIEMHAPDPVQIRNAPAAQRLVGVVAVVPGLNDDDLTRVAAAYEDEFGTPRLIQIIFFAEEPEWPDQPFMTQAFYNFAGRAYIRSSRAKDTDRTQILPLTPRWATLKDGQIVER